MLTFFIEQREEAEGGKVEPIETELLQSNDQLVPFGQVIGRAQQGDHSHRNAEIKQMKFTTGKNYIFALL